MLKEIEEKYKDTTKRLEEEEIARNATGLGYAGF